MNRQMRQLFLSTFLGGALSVVALGSGSQAAVTGQIQVLQPSTGWAISRIAANEAGSAPYCAMARKFSDDMILTFARNAKSEMSVAIDFQKDKLSTAQSYFTVLKPGYSQDRSFNVHPVSSKALVIRMGADQDFMEALNRSSRLNIDLDGEQYSFIMPDMDGGLRDMRDCLSSVTQPTQGPGASAGNGPVADSSDTSMASIAPASGDPLAGQYADDVPPVDQSAVSAAPASRTHHKATSVTAGSNGTDNADLNSIRAENAQLKDQLDQARRSFADRVASQSSDSPKSGQLTDRISQLEHQNDDLRAQLSQTVSQAQAARTQLSQLQGQTAAQGANAGKTAQLADKITQLQHQNDDLQSQLSQTSDQARTAKTQLSLLQAQTVGQQADAATVAQLTDKVAKLQRQNDDYQAQLAQTASQSDAAKAQLAKLQAQSGAQAIDSAKVAQLSDKIARLEGLNNDLQAQLTQTSSDAKNAKAELAQTRLQSADSAIDKNKQAQLAGTIAQLQKQNDDLQAQLSDTTAQAKSARAQLAQLQGQSSAQALDSVKMAQLSGRIRELESQNGDLQAQMAQTTGDAKAAHDELAQLRLKEADQQAGAGKQSQLSDQIAQLQHQNDDLQARLSETAGQAQAAKTQLSQLQAKSGNDSADASKMAALIDTIAQLKNQNGVLQDKLSQTSAAADAAKMQLAQIQLQTADQSAAGEKQAQLSDKIAQLQKQNDDLQAKLTQTNSQADAARAQMAQLQAKPQAPVIDNAKVSQLTDKIAQLESRNSDLEAKMAQTASGADAARAQLAALQLRQADQVAVSGKQSQLSDKIAQLQHQNDDLQAKLTQTDAQAQAAKTQLAALQNKPVAAAADPKMAALSDTIAKLQARNSELEARSTQTAGDAEAARQQLAQMKLRADDKRALAAHQSKVQDQIAQLQRQNDDLQARLAQTDNKAQQAQAQLAQLQKRPASPPQDSAKVVQLSDKIARLQGQNNDLQTKLSQTASAAQAAKMQLAELKLRSADQVALTGKQARLVDKIAQLQRHNDALEQQMAQTTQQAQATKMQLAQAESRSADKVAAIEPASSNDLTPFPNAAAAAAPTQELARLQDENAHLKQEIDSLHSQLATNVSVPPSVKGDDKGTTARLTARIDALEAENHRLTDSLNKVQIDPSAGIPDGRVPLAELRASEAQLEATKADRDRMQRQLDDVRTGKEDQLLAAAGTDWNLKQATQRYAESQREVDRLGRQIESEREVCTHDKKEAEYMLFDPRIATQQQIAKLTATEKDLKIAQAALSKKDAELADIRASYETKLAAAGKNSGGQQVAAAAAPPALMPSAAAPATAPAAQPAVVDLSQQAEIRDQQLALQQDDAAAAWLQRQKSHPSSASDDNRPPQMASSGAPPVKQPGANGTSGPMPVLVSAPTSPAEKIIRDDAAPSSLGTGKTPMYSAGIDVQPVSPPAPAPVASPQAPVQQAGVQPAVSTQPRFINAPEMQALLSNAGLRLTKNVQSVGAAGASRNALSWQMGTLYGSADQQLMASPAQFQSYIQTYLDKTKNRCKGQFAAVPGQTQDTGQAKTANYEIACVSGEGGGASASLLFYTKDGVFTTIAHESNVAGMDQGMDARDRLSSSLMSSKVASR